jgi:hypothetical protein
MTQAHRHFDSRMAGRVDSWAVSILPSAEIGRNTIAATEQFDLAAEANPHNPRQQAVAKVIENAITATRHAPDT